MIQNSYNSTGVKKLFLPAIFLLLAAGCSRSPVVQTPITPHSSTFNKTITVGTNTLEVFIADTDSSRANGLSGVKSISENEGMLFEFTGTPYNKPGFWMKDMLMSIDIIWIRDKKIIGITENIPAPENTNILDKDLLQYYPPSSIDKVLEVSAGWSDRHNISIGDVITYDYLVK